MIEKFATVIVSPGIDGEIGAVLAVFRGSVISGYRTYDVVPVNGYSGLNALSASVINLGFVAYHDFRILLKGKNHSSRVGIFAEYRSYFESVIYRGRLHYYSGIGRVVNAVGGGKTSVFGFEIG